MAADYDLHALLFEVNRASQGGLVLAQDMSRIVATVLDHLGCATGAQAFDLLYRDWRELSAGSLRSGVRAGEILSVVPLLLIDGAAPQRDRIDELLRAARSYGPDDPGWQAKIGALAASLSVRGDAAGSSGLDAALADTERALADLPEDSPVVPSLRVQHAALRANLAQLGGGQDDFDSALADLDKLVELPGLAPQQRLALQGQLAVFRSHQAARAEDEPALRLAVHEMESVMARLPADFMDRASFQTSIDNARTQALVLRARRGESWESAAAEPGAPTPLAELRRHCALLPDGARADALGDAGLSRSALAIAAFDRFLLAEAMELLEEALELIEPGEERWIRFTHVLGNAHCATADLGGIPFADRLRHLDQGIVLLKHAAAAAGGPEYALWPVTSISLAQAYRRRGDVRELNLRSGRRNHDEARRVGRDAVRAAAWAALLQSGTVHAAEATRWAGEHALEVARWCLADGAYEDAVGVLDAGRGLVLHAATVAATVPELLIAVGQDALAAEWRAAASDAPGPEDPGALPGGMALGPSSRLRRRVLEALEPSPVRQRVLDVPGLGEIGAALRTMRATALVYLVPGAASGMGAALIVHADGTVDRLVLDGLTTDAEPLARYRAAGGSGRVAGGPPGEVAPTPGVGRPSGLAELCDWAGREVMEPLLRHLRRGFGAAPVLVLVPMAELALVPWHAARVTGRRGRVARVCQEAQISYLPSARLLCEVARRPAAGPGPVLLVGDPTGDLRHAAEEARAVRRDFHPGAILLDERTGTPGAVRDWLRHQRGGLLHLACHGTVRRGERHSAYLALAGGTLAAEELTEDPAGHGPLDLVVLAACRTNVSGRGYDEAYSLATAFLVSGARSVVGSLWPVPDEATSLLMYMTHHYLSREGLPPGQALRRAQAWILDDRRQAPPGMAPELAARVPLVRSDDLAGWAGFTHLGW